jgi:hypothetical protein
MYPCLKFSCFSEVVEMSLRNSKLVSYECKLRKAEQALHESVQRFVESLPSPASKGLGDPRISQFADIVFASKLMERDQWFWLSPLLGGRSGWLIFRPDQPCVWLDEQMKQAYKIPIRVSQPVYEKGTVLLASLDRVDGLLRLEDCWSLAGKSTRNLPFTQRWANLTNFFDSMYCEDTHLQQGLQIKLATYDPLDAALSWSKTPHMMLAQGEKSHRRLRVQCGGDAPTAPAKRSEVPRGHGGPPDATPVKILKRPVLSAHVPSPVLTLLPDDSHEVEDHPNTARAVAHELYPDTYDLFVGSKKLGYAAVQDLALSRELKDALSKMSKKELLVRIAWNEEFGMNEIVGLI